MPTTRMSRVPLLPLAAAALAIGIFVFDTLSPLQFAVAVLYVVVVFMAATYDQRRGVVLAAGACGVLTVLSYLLAHGFTLEGTAPDRSLVSLAAIGITTFLALKYISAQERLRHTERHRANLARFFSPQRVDQLMEIDTPLSVARYQPAAVLFVDMVGFTAYCSNMAPDAVIAMLRKLLALLSASVFACWRCSGRPCQARVMPRMPSDARWTCSTRSTAGTSTTSDLGTRPSEWPSASTTATSSKVTSAVTSSWSSPCSGTRSTLPAASRGTADPSTPRCW